MEKIKTVETIEVLGFDRIGFVDEVTNTVGNFGRITQVKFDADGVKAQGKIVFQIENSTEFDRLIQRVKAVMGVVKVVRFL